MANETSRRQWWLVIRRDGYAVRKIRVAVDILQRDGSDLDRLVQPGQDSADFDLLNSLTDVDDGSGLVASYELVSTVNVFEINDYE